MKPRSRIRFDKIFQRRNIKRLLISASIVKDPAYRESLVCFLSSSPSGVSRGSSEPGFFADSGRKCNRADSRIRVGIPCKEGEDPLLSNSGGRRCCLCPSTLCT